MITPLVQRQVFQTAVAETVRLAGEGAAQVQQEQARRQSFDHKLAEAMSDVKEVEETDVLRLTDRDGQGRHGEPGTGTGGEDEPDPGQDSAEGAGPHLDLLA